jgi:glycosyltransferase involved in cell wall biosynthesis
MKNVKEVIVFSVGDSTKISTWSNVPYFFTTTLEKQGIKVNRVNLQESKNLKLLYFFCFGWMVKFFFKKSAYTYYRSALNNWDTNRKIKKAVQEFTHADLHVFLTFSFSSKPYTNKPVVLFGDWTYDHQLNYFAARKPYGFEQRSVNRENTCIENADAVVVLFPKVAAYMKEKYSNKNIHYLGNVINSNADEIIYDVSKRTNSIVFIGATKYLDGLHALIKAIEKLKALGTTIDLQVIGISANEVGEHHSFVQYHGYLDKGDTEQRKKYYEILNGAKVFVNTNEKWASFSASIEAMYHYVPVIVTPYPEFVETFGSKINFGMYCGANGDLSALINGIISANNYNEICSNAHDAVKDYTWEKYIENVIEIVD